MNHKKRWLNYSLLDERLLMGAAFTQWSCCCCCCCCGYGGCCCCCCLSESKAKAEAKKLPHGCAFITPLFDVIVRCYSTALVHQVSSCSVRNQLGRSFVSWSMPRLHFAFFDARIKVDQFFFSPSLPSWMIEFMEFTDPFPFLVGYLNNISAELRLG